MTTAIMCEHGARPEHIQAAAKAVLELEPTEAETITNDALKELWQQTVKTHSPDEAVMIYMFLVKMLDETHRLYAANLVLQFPQGLSDTTS
jgi:hypothetical protein